MDLHIGTSGWSSRELEAGVLPEKLPSKRFLEFYATRLNAVELNATFRRMPTPNAIAGWWRYAAGLPLCRQGSPVNHAFQAAQGLRRGVSFLSAEHGADAAVSKLGPILIQTPPNLKADIDLLRTFAQLLPRPYRFAFDFRHESWLTTRCMRF